MQPECAAAFSRSHQDCIEADVADRCVRICRQPDIRSGRNSPALPFIDGFRSFIEAGVRLNFCEHQKLTTPRDDIDLAEWTSPAPRKNAEFFGDQKNGGTALGR